MYRKLNVAHYAKIIAKERGMPVWKVHIVLMFAWLNVVTMMRDKQDIRFKNFGKIFYDKTGRTYEEGNLTEVPLPRSRQHFKREQRKQLQHGKSGTGAGG